MSTVLLKLNKYEVDFYDVDVMEAVEDGSALVEQVTNSLEGEERPTKKIRKTCEAMMKAIDLVVGEGASKESFAGKTNWKEIVTAWKSILHEYAAACKDGTESMKDSFSEFEGEAPVQASISFNEVPMTVARKPVKLQ